VISKGALSSLLSLSTGEIIDQGKRRTRATGRPEIYASSISSRGKVTTLLSFKKKIIIIISPSLFYRYSMYILLYLRLKGWRWTAASKEGVKCSHSSLRTALSPSRAFLPNNLAPEERRTGAYRQTIVTIGTETVFQVVHA
jgi:hypothetical protein